MIRHRTITQLEPEEVLARARSFFALAATPSAAFPEQADDGYLKLHLETGEIVIAAGRGEGGTWVQGTASRASHLLARFLTTLGSPLNVTQASHRYRLHETRGAQVADARIGSAPTLRAVRAA